MQVAGVQSVKLDFYQEICIHNNLVNISKNGMKMVVGYLRNQDFQTFLKLVECLCTPAISDKSDTVLRIGLVSSIFLTVA